MVSGLLLMTDNRKWRVKSAEKRKHETLDINSLD